MNLALVLGRSSENVKPKLASVRDNLNITCFNDLQSFIDDSIKRDLAFDRIIILSTLVKDSTAINSLYNFWMLYQSECEIIYLCRKTTDDELAKLFLHKFCSVFVTSMSVTSTTLSTLSEAVTLPVKKLIELYGMPDYLSVEVESDVFVPEPEPEHEIQPTVQPEVPINNTPKEKRTFFGALFGKKKKQDNTQNNDKNNPTSTVENNPEPEQVTEELENEDISYIPADEPSKYSDDASNFTNKYEIFESQYEDENSLVTEDFSDLSNENLSPVDDSDNFSGFDNSSEVVADDFDDLTEKVVEDEFGDLTFTPEDIGSKPVAQTAVEEVEDIKSDLSVGVAEDQYRKTTETPKVVTETVVKEVIKSVKTSSILDSIYKGTAHKIIIVTGDRGTGVTTTAWTLAQHFAQKTQVLYFDCDIKFHGLLNYINYFDFKNYEQTHMQGVKICRSFRAFNSCVCKWDTNIDLLTTDFGVEVTEDELITTQGVVVENLSSYGVIVVDCPIQNLHCLQDLILTGNVVVCVEGSVRGYMNALFSLEECTLPLRYKRSVVGKGTMLRTKINKNSNYKKIVKYINDIVEFDECDWLSMPTLDFNGNLTKELLTEIVEG